MTTDTDILEMLAQGATHDQIKAELKCGSERITRVRAIHGYSSGHSKYHAAPRLEVEIERADDAPRIDLLGEALERAGYKRHTVKSDCQEFAPRIMPRSAFDTQSIMGSHF